MNVQLKGVLLYTDEGVKLVCKNESGMYWTAEKCFDFCNSSGSSDFDNNKKANKLKMKSILINKLPKKKSDWYKHRENFQTIELMIIKNEEDKK